MNRNWRMTFVWTAAILALNNGFQLMVIYNVPWITLVALESHCMPLPRIETCRRFGFDVGSSEAWGVGQDGWFYAFGSNILMIIQGIAQVLSSLAVVEISPSGYEASVMAVNLAGALTFCWFLPQQKEQCKDWAEDCLR
eukprot:Skav227602  [mRNA]  locus=scaffold1141:353819:355849:+ [translate_table: standard]